MIARSRSVICVALASGMVRVATTCWKIRWAFWLMASTLVNITPAGGCVKPRKVGTGEWHVGEPRDRRSSEVGQRRGIPLGGRARQFVASDFACFDYVLAMDGQNLATLRDLAPDATARAKVSLLRSFDPHAPTDADVPDPYYGGPQGFERVFDICDAACRGLLAKIRRTAGI